MFLAWQSHPLNRCLVAWCGMRFALKSRLQAHMKTHTDGYICGQDGCVEAFSKWSELCLHRRRGHSGAFKCSVCNRVSRLSPAKGYVLPVRASAFYACVIWRFLYSLLMSAVFYWADLIGISRWHRLGAAREIPPALAGRTQFAMSVPLVASNAIPG